MFRVVVSVVCFCGLTQAIATSDDEFSACVRFVDDVLYIEQTSTTFPSAVFFESFERFEKIEFSAKQKKIDLRVLRKALGSEQLRALSLWKCELEETWANDVSFYSALESLEVDYCKSSPLTNKESRKFFSLKNLEFLSLKGMRISRSFFQVKIPGDSALRSIVLLGCDCDEEVLKKFEEANPEIVIRWKWFVLGGSAEEISDGQE